MLFTIGRLSVCVMVILVAGCGLGPDPKLGSYVTVHEQPPADSFLDRFSANHRLPVGLLVLNDTTEKESAPSLSEESIASLTRFLTQEIQNQHPFRVVQVIESQHVQTGNPSQLSLLGKQAGVDYLLVAILSSEEIETPDRLPLQGINQGGARGRFKCNSA